MSALGLIGILLFLMGVLLLWQARREILYWMQEFFRILRGEVSRRGGLSSQPQGDAIPAGQASLVDAGISRRTRNMGTLLLLGGFALIVLGQVLFLLDLAF